MSDPQCNPGKQGNVNYLYDGLLSAFEPDSRPLFRLLDGSCWSYADAIALSARFANLLVSLGVKRGDRIAVQVAKSVEAVALYIAAIRCGAVYLPLNTAYTANEVAYFLTDAEPAVLICDSDNEQALSGLARKSCAILMTLNADGSGSLLDAAQSQSSDFVNCACAEGDIAAILYTSGTTGQSKGAMLSHGNLLSNAQTLTQYWLFDSDDVLLHALPIFHTHGLFVAINVVLLARASMIFLKQFDVEDIKQQLPLSTAMMGVPTFYTRLLAQPDFSRETVGHMRLLISGSAPLLTETHVQFEALTGHRILERYGMTETNMNTSNPYDGERRAGSVGFPLPGVEVMISDPLSGVELAQGDIGMIEVRGPNVFQGYWRQPEKTAAELRANGFFITGDLGRIDQDGYLHIVGRDKDLIIAGGYNIYPKQIETEIDLLDGVYESAVFGISHPDLGESVVAAVVLIEGAQLNEQDLKTALGQRLAKFKQPRHVVFLQELPRNTMGKVQKNRLRETYAELNRKMR